MFPASTRRRPIVGKLDFRAVNLGLCNLHGGFQLRHKRFLLIDELGCDGVIGKKVVIAAHILLGGGQFGLNACFFCGCTRQIGRKAAVIDGRQQHAFFDVLTFVEQHLGQLAIRLRPHGNLVQRDDISDTREINGEILRGRIGDADGNSGRCAERNGLVAALAPRIHASGQSENEEKKNYFPHRGLSGWSCVH
jgi:hypothetical protein